MKDLLPLIITLVTGVVIFYITELVKKHTLRRELKTKLLAKIQFWAIDSYEDDFEDIILLGFDLSSKFNYLSNGGIALKIKKDLNEKIEEVIDNVIKEFNKGDSVESFVASIKAMPLEKHQFGLEYLDKMEVDLKDGTSLLDKSEIEKLDIESQIGYHDFYKNLFNLITEFKFMLITIRSLPEEDHTKLMTDLVKQGIKTSVSMFVFMNKIKNK